MKTELRYVVHDPDKRGNDRYYVRLKGHAKIRVRHPFKDADGNITQDFMVAYWAALAELRGEAERKQAAPQPRETTFLWLCNQYYRSVKFHGFDIATQRDKRSVLDRFCETAGELPYKKYRRVDMERSQLARKAHPGAADKLVKVIRALFNWAMEQSPPLATENPAAKVSTINKAKGGFHTWTPEEIDKYRDFWRIGSKPRLAMEVMINIGARLSDAAQIGPRQEFKHEGERWTRFVAHKGRNRFPTTIEAKLTPELIDALAKTETGRDAYIVSGLGRPYAIASLGNTIKKWCTEAGLPHCSSHGLRKAAAVAFAESGATAPELMAVFGWSNLRTAQIYIEKANKRRMRSNAFDRKATYEMRDSVPLTTAKKPIETNGAEKNV